ncbi:MAG: M4 family metallopeptidase [Bacteroidetes bacterium]|nr:M4 family metallopeptidase [Bacteroidota bacterium]
MKKIVFTFHFICILSLFSQTGSPANSGFKITSYSKFDSVPSYIKFTNKESPIIISENINYWFQKNLNGNTEFNLRKKSSNYDLVGNYHEKFIQYYKNLPVINSMVNIHYKANKIHSLNGYYFPELNISATPLINEQNALKIALANYPINTEYAWQNKAYENLIQNAHGHSIFPEGKLCIVAKNFIYSKNNFHLAYQFKIYGVSPVFAETVYIDAINGEVLHTENLICHIDVNGKGISKFSGVKDITCDSISPSNFKLQENGLRKLTTLNAYNLTKDFQEFSNTSNFWDLDTSANKRIAIDIHWGLEKTLDFLKFKLNRNSIDNQDFRIVGIANYDKSYSNAFWNGQFAAFGDGDGIRTGPFGTLDVCGHEVSHGLTQYTAGLVYSYESGALNESFSDIFGKCIDHYAYPKSFNWTIGKNIYLNGASLRDMRDPYFYNDPKYYYGSFYAKSADDNGGVHTNSSVQNHWFYLLCNGGKERHEKTKVYHTVDSIGWDKATAIAYSNLVDYLTPQSEYQEAADLSIEIAGDMYGIGSNIQKQVILAWYMAGLALLPVSSVNSYSIAKNVAVYPNPAQNTLTIEGAAELESIKITDISGRIILKTELSADNSIDIQFLKSGIYFIQFSDGSLQKFVKL